MQARFFCGPYIYGVRQVTKTQEPSKKQVDQRGLAGQTIGDTAVCAVNQTQLMYRGYEIADLAANATFEEVAYVLLVGEKPNAEQLTSFSQEQGNLSTSKFGTHF